MATAPTTATPGATTGRATTPSRFKRFWLGLWRLVAKTCVWLWAHPRVTISLMIVVIIGWLGYYYWPTGKPVNTAMAAPTPTTSPAPPAKVVVTDSAQPSTGSDEYKNRLEQVEKELAELKGAKGGEIKPASPAEAKPSPTPSPAKPAVNEDDGHKWNCMNCN